MGKLTGKVRHGLLALLRRNPRLAEALAAHEYASKWVTPVGPEKPDDSPWTPTTVLGDAGIELHAGEQVERLSRWRGSSYQEVFRVIRNDPTINLERVGSETIANGWYNTPDAEVYAAMIMDLKPRRIVEVGGGFSTRIARATVTAAGLNTSIAVVDPEPRADVRSIADDLFLAPVETSLVHELDWAAGDVLFIDSSHICRTRGDVPYLFCGLIPRLPVGVIVHVHDIFLPFDYPNNLDRLWYTEQYVLHALLSGAPRYRTMLATHWLSRSHGEEMRLTFGATVGRDPRLLGDSYWFEIV